MNKKAIVASRFILAVSFLGVLAGCPDRSMLREYPDLSKQSDTDSEDSEGTLTDEAESPDASSAPPRPEPNK